MEWPIPPIVTQRLTVREAVHSDAALFERLLLDPQVRAHLGGPVPESELRARVADVPWRGVFAVELNETRESIGLVHIGPYRTGEIELSYEFVPETWGNGYAREACEPVLGWASRDVTHGGPIIAVTQVANSRSVTLLRSLGMVERERFQEFGALQVLMTESLKETAYLLRNPENARRLLGSIDRLELGTQAH